jgi:glycosyltransferase involved in cell wall biosynthesis
MSPQKICALVPTFNNPLTIAKVTRDLRARGLEVVIVDDGSEEPGRRAAADLAGEEGVHLLVRDVNGGKGAAVQDGFRHALSLGFTHALQVDADGQHHLEDVPRFVAAAEETPEALVLGHPVFDASVPKGRLVGRQISIFWCAIETGGRKIVDPLCGFRVYPLSACARLGALGQRMDFDPEIAVRLVWQGVPLVNLPTQVIYLSAEEGGVSSFNMVKDNVRISWMHTRLVTIAIVLALTWPLRRVFRALVPRSTGA